MGQDVKPHEFLGTIDQFMDILPDAIVTWLTKNTVDGMTVMETAAVMLTDYHNEQEDSGITSLEERIRHCEMKNSLPVGSIGAAINIVAKITMVSTREIFSTKKQPYIYRARMLMAGITKDVFDLSLMDMGYLFKRDHTSMLHTVKRYDSQCQEDPSFKVLSDIIHDEVRMFMEHAEHNVKRMKVPRPGK